MRGIVVRVAGVGLGALGAAAAVALPLVNGPAEPLRSALPGVPAATVRTVAVARPPARATLGPRPLPEARAKPEPVAQLRIEPPLVSRESPSAPAVEVEQPVAVVSPAAPHKAKKDKGNKRTARPDPVGVPAAVVREHGEGGKHKEKHRKD